MKVFMLWKYYPEYLSYFYKKYSSVINLSFEEQRNRIFDDHFGWPADLARYMNREGIQTEFIIANVESLQKKWAEENSFKSYSQNEWEKEIAMEQIRRLRPDILWITSIFDYYGRFVKEALAYSRKAITWVGSPWEVRDASGFSVLLTENPYTFRSIQDRFEKVIVTKPFFNSEILNKVIPAEKEYKITFIGGITPVHTRRAKILSYLIENGIDLNVFGYVYEPEFLGKWKALRQSAGHILKRRNLYKGIDTLKHMFIKTDYQRDVEVIKSVKLGPVFGVDMYRILAASYIVLNIYADIVKGISGNMRMFESTGIGSCLLTEYSKNIDELFTSEEILTYKSKEELLEIVQKIFSQKEKVKEVARAGQKKTLQNHTVERMFNDIKPAFEV